MEKFTFTFNKLLLLLVGLLVILALVCNSAANPVSYDEDGDVIMEDAEVSAIDLNEPASE